ncbi:MAG: hypothetical protein CMF55_00880 [Legionellales bacterium]|nr:hypothetical protein [Legionellales bacterium]|tara:strand:- start:489 stop:1142 length:654 start_codon:yes stop_codon:yes gene_type:complete
MRTSRLTPLIAILTGITLQSTALATPDQPRIQQTINIFDNQITYPMSAWQEAEYHQLKQSKRKSELFNTYRQQKNRSFIFEQIPSKETFKIWTKLNAISAIFHPDQKQVTPEHIAYNNKDTFKKSCTSYQYIEIPVQTKTSRGLIVTIFCEQIKKTQEGEIMVKFITTTPNLTSIQIYSEWKGAPFNALDEKTWPVSWDTIKDQIERYKMVDIVTKQ